MLDILQIVCRCNCECGDFVSVCVIVDQHVGSNPGSDTWKCKFDMDNDRLGHSDV